MKEELAQSKGRRSIFWIGGLLLLFVMTGGVTRADIKWEKLVYENVAPVGQEAFRTAFRFTNEAKGPVRIVRLEPSCGCTTAALKKDLYAGGETGEVEVEFDGKGLSGLQVKTVKVFTDESPTPITLTIRITIPAWLEITPRLLWWSVGDQSAPKEAVITVNQAAKVRVSLLSSDNPAMKVAMEEDGAGRYRLKARPDSTQSPMQATMTIVAEIPGASPRRYLVFAHVR